MSSLPHADGRLSNLGRIKQGEIFSRVLLMLGHGYDDQSILDRLKIDVGLNWSYIELDLVKATAARFCDNWSRALIALMTRYKITFDEAVTFRRTLELKGPGEAGFNLGRTLINSKRSADPSGVWSLLPAHTFAVHAGMVLAYTYRSPVPLRRLATILRNERSRMEHAGFTPERFQELIGVTIPKGAPAPLEAKLAAIQISFAKRPTVRAPRPATKPKRKKAS